MLLVPTAGMAQRWRQGMAKKQVRESVVAKQARKGAPVMAAKRAAEGSLMLPTHEDTYLYEDGEWIDDATYDLTYDKKGNVLTQTETYETDVTKTVYEYDENSMETSETVYVGETGGELENSSRLVRAYDGKVASLIVSSEEYTWLDDWTLINAGRTYKREVSRDDSGNVTGTTLQDYYDGEYMDMEGSAITYGEDGKATTWESKRMSNYGSLITYLSFSDIVWDCTDGQIVTLDYNDFFSGNNRIASAIYSDTEGGVDASVVATYGENGAYSYYMQPEGYDMRDVYTRTADDENGSYTLVADYYTDMNGDGEYTDDEIDFSDKTVITYDAHGNLTSELYYSDDELYAGMKYEYTYNADSDYPAEAIHYEYDERSGDFEPMLKVVSTDFVDVATGIETVSGNYAAAPQAVYNLQGAKVASSVRQLPAGIYIVKSGNQAKKVAVK